MKREIRSSAIISTAAVGAIIDVGQESFLTPAIQHWIKSQMRDLHLPRVSNRLGKALRKLKDDDPIQRTRRFPRALFCEKCRGISLWQVAYEEENQEAKCPKCHKRGNMVPMRYVLACRNGHVGDFPWARWAHSGDGADKGCRHNDSLRFDVDATMSSNLDALIVRCTKCNSKRSLEGISSSAATVAVTGGCRGEHPWRHDREDCDDDKPQALQRGAANLYYPSTISALDIPMRASRDDGDLAEFGPAVRAHQIYKTIKQIENNAAGSEEILKIMRVQIAQTLGCSETVVSAVLKQDESGDGGAASDGAPQGVEQDELLREELAVLSEACRTGRLEVPNFRAFRENLPAGTPAWIRRVVKGVLLVERLREVRVFRGFNRIDPADRDRMVPPDAGADEGWLPAAENFGEGIFLSLDTETLTKWVQKLPEDERRSIEELEKHRDEENFWFLPQVNPPLLAIHSFSHLLLRQLSFECGYAPSALRERIYLEPGVSEAGLLIYTAEGDADGSLGGLVRQGRGDRLVQTIVDSVEQGRWCSADPVCSETAGQGLGGLNRAACHACTLVPETSCAMANSLLDRRFLVDEEWGLVNFAEKAR